MEQPRVQINASVDSTASLVLQGACENTPLMSSKPSYSSVRQTSVRDSSPTPPRPHGIPSDDRLNLSKIFKSCLCFCTPPQRVPRTRRRDSDDPEGPDDPGADFPTSPEVRPVEDTPLTIGDADAASGTFPVCLDRPAGLLMLGLFLLS